MYRMKLNCIQKIVLSLLLLLAIECNLNAMDESETKKLELVELILLPNGNHMRAMYEPRDNNLCITTFDKVDSNHVVYMPLKTSLLSHIRTLGLVALPPTFVLVAALAQATRANDTLVLARFDAKNSRYTLLHCVINKAAEFKEVEFYANKINAMGVKALVREDKHYVEYARKFSFSDDDLNEPWVLVKKYTEDITP